MSDTQEVTFVDTTIRDGQMSLWATSMTTAMILPLVEQLDEAGFASVEVIAPAFCKKMVRELFDDPFERLRRIRELAPRTRLRAISSRHTAAFQITPVEIYRVWNERLKANGVDEIRLSDPSNTPAMWRRNKQIAADAGLDVVVNLIYSSSPKHTDAYYRERADEAAALDPLAICLKDPGGLLTPDRLRTLVPTIQSAIGSRPLEFHGHSNNGFGLVNAMEAVELGIRIVHTAIRPLANGSSLPDSLRLAANLRERGYHIALDDTPVAAVAERLEELRVARDWPQGRPAEYEERYYRHQVPGGMISNLRYQLSTLGLDDRLEEVLDEVAVVRRDLGYPIMVTPYSQFVGSQAALNVLTGSRYSQVTDEVLQYALGLWGEEEADAVDPDIRGRLLANPRAAEISGAPAARVTVDEVRRQVDAVGLSDEEFLLRVFTSEADVRAMREVAPISPTAVEDPWVALVERLGAVTGLRRASVRKGSSSIVLGR